MRVVMVGDYPRDPQRIRGGVEAVTHQLAQGLSRTHQVELHLVTRRKDVTRYTKETGHGDYVVHYLPASRRLPGLLAGPLWDRPRLLRWLHLLQPDIIHAHGQEWYADAALRSGKPTIVTVHGIRHRETSLPGRSPLAIIGGIVYNRLEANILRRTQHLIVISPYVLDAVRPWFRGVVYPIDNPVADAYFALDGEDSGEMVLFVGNLSPRKGLPLLLQAFADVARRRPAARLVVVGQGRDAKVVAELKGRADILGIAGWTDFTGQLPDAQVLACYRECALLVLPSLEESAPVVVAQAMAVGKPVVATRVGGVPYMVTDGETGFLVPRGDAVLLAERIIRLLSDAELRQRMGRQARQEAEARFRLERIAEKTMAAYRAVLGTRGA